MQRYERNIRNLSTVVETAAPAPIGDGRFRALLQPADWAALPARVRRRFGERAHAGEAIVYAGEIVECRRTKIGRLVVELSRLIGAPLPLSRDVGVAAIVSVMEDGEGGQFWTRAYLRRRGFPQVIHSRKRFGGETGLEELLRFGVGIALDLGASAEGLHFVSRFYFLALAGVRLRLPAWAAPGVLTVGHVDRPDGAFLFTLSLRHPWFGEILWHSGVFRERRSEGETL